MLEIALPVPQCSLRRSRHLDKGGAPAQRAGVCRSCHAVYREFGSVPTPPNLRPISRAGATPVKGLPDRATRQRALEVRPRRGRLKQVRAGVGIAARDGQRGGRRARADRIPVPARTVLARRSSGAPAAVLRSLIRRPHPARAPRRSPHPARNECARPCQCPASPACSWPADSPAAPERSHLCRAGNSVP